MLEADGLILDMDGVLWRGPEPLPGLVPLFETVGRLGIAFVLATNNSTRTVKQYVDKLDALGVQVEPERILTSAGAAAGYLLRLGGAGAGVYVVGEAGLVAAMESGGFHRTEEGADYVVAGLDRGFSYQKLATAASLIRGGARFVGTNPDLTLPTPDGPRPGAGAILAAIAAACGVEPTIVGKPEPLMFRQALARLGTRPDRTFMVGDRLETDIEGGRTAGLGTILLLSGVTTTGQLAQSTVQPDWVMEDIRALADAFGG